MKVFVKAKPGSKMEKIQSAAPELWESSNNRKELTVWVKEPPTQGRANTAIAEALATYFKVSKSQVSLVSGFSSKNKVFEISI